MKTAVLCIGDELLKGAVANTNLRFIGESLLAEGIVPELAMEVRDRGEDIKSALEFAFSRADTVLVSGGLGPTADDVTKEAAAGFLRLPLVEDEKTHIALLRVWRGLRDHGDSPSRFLNQAMIPEGAETIPNAHGTAPGLRIEQDGRTLILLPGPPPELEPMFVNQVIPVLREKRGGRIHSVLLHVAGVPESVVEERILPILAPNLEAAYCASPGLVKLFLSGRDPEMLHDKFAAARKIFEGELLAPNLSTLQEEVVLRLRRANANLATAESCTGGMIAERITAVPGASEVFLGGVVTYSNELKMKLLGVREDTLEAFGAVSAETCSEMLDGIAKTTGASVAAAVTGIAGPGGGSVEKPVGLVYTGIRVNGENHVTENRFRGGRDQIREKTCAEVLNALRRALSILPEKTK